MKILKCVFLVGMIISLGQSADLQSLKAKAKEVAANSAHYAKLGKEQDVLFDEKNKIVRAYLPHLQEAQEWGDRAEYNALINERDNKLAPIERKIKELGDKQETIYKKEQNLLKEMEDIAIALGTSNDEAVNSFAKLAKQKRQVDKDKKDKKCENTYIPKLKQNNCPAGSSNLTQTCKNLQSEYYKCLENRISKETRVYQDYFKAKDSLVAKYSR